MIKSAIFDRNPLFMLYRLSVSIAAIFCCVISAKAQYTETINSNRPGESQGAFSVGRGVLQLEGGIGYGKEEHSLFDTEADSYTADYSIRYGLLKEELEISFIGSYQRNDGVDNRFAIPQEYKQANFRSNTLGAKYLFYDPYLKRDQKGPNLYSWKANNRFQWADLIPAISIYAGANFDSAENPYTPELDFTISPKFVLSTQNNWLGGWVFVTNIVVDRVTTEYPTYGYIITLTHAFNPKFSAFIENQGFKSDFYADQILRGGVAFLINKDFQVDLSGFTNFKDTPTRTFGRLGVSYRFDFHAEDDFIEEKGKAGRDKRREREMENEKQKRRDGFEDDGGGDNGGIKLQ